MKLIKKVTVEAPIGMYVVSFDLVWGTPCNPGKHDDCLQHGCMDNEPNHVSKVDGSLSKVTLKNWQTLGVEGLNINSNTNDQHDDTHDFRTRIFKTKKDATDHLKYTLNRFKNPRLWDSFIKV